MALGRKRSEAGTYPLIDNKILHRVKLLVDCHHLLRDGKMSKLDDQVTAPGTLDQRLLTQASFLMSRREDALLAIEPPLLMPPHRWATLG